MKVLLYFLVCARKRSHRKPQIFVSHFCRCLNPGKYSQHLERWLSYYPPQQLLIVDGEQLRNNPIGVMNDLQRFLKLSPPFDYSKHLRYVTF